MEIYLVGGAVRDQLLGIVPKERDWVVVGATPELMLSLGYRPVGKDFPVFLHPETKEEYALARTERKTAPGYKGFNFYAAPDVTLEEDLKRRDLTINAMAQMTNGQIVDPYGGTEDLKNKILRHVSNAFTEDPVRILRLARFAARFGQFTIHPQTLVLMQEMVKAGEVNALVAERVWQEWRRALAESAPQRFFEVLNESRALPVLFPELQNEMADLTGLIRATQLSAAPAVRFAALLHKLESKQLQGLCQRYRIPQDFCELAGLVVRYQGDYQQLLSLDAEGLLKLLEALDAFRRSERLQLFLATCEIIDPGATTSKSSRLHQAYELAVGIDPQPIVQRGLKGEEIKEALRQERAAAIRMSLIHLPMSS